MTVRRYAAPLASVIAALAVLATGCGGDVTPQVDAATSGAIVTSLRGLPAVTAATTTETSTPIDTLMISMTTGLDRANTDDLTSATELLRAAADMAYATRHDTVDAVAVTVYGVDSAGAGSEPTALLAQHRFKARDLAAGSS